MSSSVMPSAPLQDQRLEHRGVEPAVGLGLVRQRGVGDRLVLEREPQRLRWCASQVAELRRGPSRRSARARRRRPRSISQSRSSASRSASRARRRGRSAAGGWGRRSGPGPAARRGTSARSGARPRRRSPRRRRARSRSGGGRRRSAARRRPSASLDAPRSRPASATRQSRWTRAVVVGDLAPRLAVGVRRERAPRGAGRVVVEAEDGGEVGARRARQPQPVLLRARVRALVRADAAGAVVLDAHAREEARGACSALPSGPV